MNINSASGHNNSIIEIEPTKRSITENAVGLCKNPLIYKPTNGIQEFGTIFALLSVLFKEFVQTLLSPKSGSKLENNLKTTVALILINRARECQTLGIADIVKHSVEKDNHLNSSDPNDILSLLDRITKNKEIIVFVNRSDEEENESKYIMFFALVISIDFILVCDLKEDYFVLMNINDFRRKVAKDIRRDSQTYLIHHNNDLLKQFNNLQFLSETSLLYKKEKDLENNIDDFAFI